MLVITRTVLALAGAWVVWRVANENLRWRNSPPVALLPKPVDAEASETEERHRSRRKTRTTSR
jgi:hypothetical protein